MVASASRRPVYPQPNWRLVGPWYRWDQPALPAAGRISRPAIQKFAGDNFIQDFLEKPQHSLKYDEVIDVVNTYDLVSATSKMSGKIGTILKINSAGDATDAEQGPFRRARLAPSGLRKLYQPTHDRHYLVTCELHCEEPGFPRVARQKVCQSGFVVRRRRSVAPPNANLSEVTKTAQKLQALEADLLELLTLDALTHDPQASASLKANALREQASFASKAGAANWPALLASRRAALTAKREELQSLYKTHNIQMKIDGWFPAVQQGRVSKIYGAWIELDEAGQTADIDSGEQSYPMFPLIADPRLTDHDATGRTMYYGVIPTTGLQHDANGVARFDDLTTYEVRCFVRQHVATPSRVGKTPDCCGPVIWSLPTEAFRVAAPFDVLGSANRPVTIKMPDLRELAAQAAMRPRGRLSPIRFVQPQHLSPKIKDKALDGGSMGGEAICSFSIPLITIIALFVLNLFLPIVVFIFQLWFLLVFRFCIPPKLSINLGLDAALAATPPKIDLDVDLALEVDGTKLLASKLNSDLQARLSARIKADNELTDSSALGKLGLLSNNALGSVAQSFADTDSLQLNASSSNQPTHPPVGMPLIYEDPVSPVWPTAGAQS